MQETWDADLIPGWGRSPGGGHGNPLQYSCLENCHGQGSLVGYGPWGCKELSVEKEQPLRRSGSLVATQPECKIKAGDNLPQGQKPHPPPPPPPPLPALLQTAPLVYLASRVVCLYLEWELELSWLCVCPAQKYQTNKQTKKPHLTNSCLAHKHHLFCFFFFRRKVPQAPGFSHFFLVEELPYGQRKPGGAHCSCLN